MISLPDCNLMTGSPPCFLMLELSTTAKKALTASPTRYLLIALVGWLLLPTVVGIVITPAEHGPARTLQLCLFALAVLAAPLVALGTFKRLFLFWLPLALLVPVQCYLIYFFQGTPGDAFSSWVLLS